MIPVFDGHNDILLRLLNAPDRREAIWLGKDGTGHLDLPRMKKAGFAGGFFAIYVPSPHGPDDPDFDALMVQTPYEVPLPVLIDHATAQPTAMAMAGALLWMERVAGGAFKVCRSAAEVRACVADGTIAAIMHMEGAEAIGPDLDALHVWHAAGLRSLGPVWSRPTVFGHGVPFKFPGDPDTGPGLTDAGKALVRECDDLGIMIDLSHLNEKGFDDVAAISNRPLVATHSNAHAVSASTRNLTDRQLAAIRDSDGMVGLNFATVFLRPDGLRTGDFGWDVMLRHLDHLVTHLGETRVGFGSDFDGAPMPDPVGDVTGVQGLCDAMLAHGFGADLVRRIACDNWLALLGRSLPG